MLVRLTDSKVAGRLQKARAGKQTHFWPPSEPPVLGGSVDMHLCFWLRERYLPPSRAPRRCPPTRHFLSSISLPEPFSDTKLKLDSSTVILCFTSGKASVDTSSHTCNPRTADGGSQTIHRALDSGCKAACWGLLAAFSFPIRVCPRCMSQRNETDLPLKSISFSAWLLTYLSHKTTSSLGKSNSQP